jgi:hypothetical protein
VSLAEGLVLDVLHNFDGGRAAQGAGLGLLARGADGGHG